MTLKYDPLNIVVCGIGGQGNVLAAEILGSAMCDRGCRVAVGETYGASQRGGSVMSLYLTRDTVFVYVFTHVFRFPINTILA